MDSKYIIGISEIDAQHDEIEAIFSALQMAMDNQDQWKKLPEILDRLHEQLRFHFTFEESVMQISAYPEAQEHRAVHQMILKSVEGLKNSYFSGKSDQISRELPVNVFHDQILNHDLRFGRFVSVHKDRLGLK